MAAGIIVVNHLSLKETNFLALLSKQPIYTPEAEKNAIFGAVQGVLAGVESCQFLREISPV